MRNRLKDTVAGLMIRVYRLERKVEKLEEEYAKK